MIKKLTFLVGILYCLQLNAQQELGLYFMQELGQNRSMNPALAYDYGFHFGFPSVAVEYNNSAFPLGDLFRVEGNKWFVNPEKALEKVSLLGNYGRLNGEMETISFGFQEGKFPLNIWHKMHFDGFMEYPSSLLEILWNGNAPFTGETINIAPQINFKAYHEFGIGTRFNLNEQLAIGVNVKYLQGMLAMKTERASLDIYTDPEYYQLTVQSDIAFYTSGFEADFYKADATRRLVRDTRGIAIANQNRGGAIDLGVTYEVDAQLQLSFSAIDLGWISWKSFTQRQQNQVTYTFEGLDVNPLDTEQEFEYEEIIDSIQTEFELDAEELPFRTGLTPRFYLGGTYQLPRQMEVGALLYGDLYHDKFNAAIALSFRKRIGQIVDMGLLTSYQGTPTVGANMTLWLGGLQLFAISDNLITLFRPDRGQHTNIRVGLNLAYRYKKEKKDPPSFIGKKKDTASEEEQQRKALMNPWN